MPTETLLKLKDLTQETAETEVKQPEVPATPVLPEKAEKFTPTQTVKEPYVSSAKRTLKPKKSLIEKLNEIGTIKQAEVVEFTRHLAVMLSAGVTIFEAVTFLRDQTKNKVFASKLTKIISSLNNGHALSAAMKRFPKVFPEVYTNIIQVGESSGTLSETMLDLADHLEESDKFKKKVKGALIYPKIILAVMVVFLFVLFFWVMPRILTVFESLGADVPFATQIVISITNFLQNKFMLLIGIIAGTYVLAKTLIKNKTIRWYRDLSYIKAPLVGRIVLNYNTTQIAQHFGTLFESGLTILKCLETTESVIANTVFQREIKYMVGKIKTGSSFSQSFKPDSQFPPMFVKLIKVGERTGKLPHVIKYMKDYYKGLVDNDVKNITAIIEPVIMVVLGMLVAGLVVTVIGPIYQLISNIGA